jgi:hypothetical protein
MGVILENRGKIDFFVIYRERNHGLDRFRKQIGVAGETSAIKIRLLAINNGFERHASHCACQIIIT